MNAEPVQIVISSGPEAAERAVLGFATAAAAVASGVEVILFLAMNGVDWAYQRESAGPEVAGFPSVAECIELVQAAGGRVEACANCMDGACSAGGQLREGILPGGISTAAIRMTRMRTVTF